MSLTAFPTGCEGSMGIQNAHGGRCVVRHDSARNDAWLTLELPCSDIAGLATTLEALGFIPKRTATVQTGRRLGSMQGQREVWMERYDAVSAWMKAQGLIEWASHYQASMGIENASGSRCVVRHDPVRDVAWLTLELPCSNIAELEAKLAVVGFLKS
jgi:hypothetical protein